MKNDLIHILKSLLKNIRFYILIAAIVASALIYLIVGMIFADERLRIIRLQEVYSVFSLALLYTALLITPLTGAFKVPGASKLLKARRAIGVSAFYFGLLHALIAYLSQFGGIETIGLLSSTYLWALGSGLFALFVLFLMAITSFDKAISIIGFSRWKLLHRLVYLAGFALLIHVYTIGSHFNDLTSLPSLIFLLAVTVLATLWSVGLDRNTELRFGTLGPFMMSLMLTVGIFSAALLFARLVEADVITPIFAPHSEEV